MIRVTLTAVVADSTPLFLRHGPVNTWSRQITRHVGRQARNNAPPNRSEARHGTWATGALAASIYADMDANPFTRHIDVQVGARVPHARYVHEGTADNGHGYIYTHLGYINREQVDRWVLTGTRPHDTRGYVMPVSRRRGPDSASLALRVRGQRANPFLVDGYNTVAAHYRLPHML